MIFIVGNSRSGTTMLGRTFGMNSAVHTFDELHFFEQQITSDDLERNPVWSNDRLVALAERLITSSREGLFAPTARGRYSEEAQAIIAQLGESRPVDLYLAVLQSHARQGGKSIPLEQTPRYLFLAQEILRRFPDSHMINIIRDPRDVLLSQKNRWRVQALAEKEVPWIWTVRSWANYHPFTTAKLWNGAIRMANRMAQHPRFHSIHYEDLLQTPEVVLQDLCTKIGLPFESEMLQVSQIGSSLKSDQPQALGFDKSRMGAWKNGGLSRTELKICEQVTGDLMVENHYALANEPANPLKVLLVKAGFPIKLVIAGFANLNRVANLRQAIARRLKPPQDITPKLEKV